MIREERSGDDERQAVVTGELSQPWRMVETSPGKFSLLLMAGSTQVDEVVARLGHEPNGYFWEGVARLLVSSGAPGLDEHFAYGPEADMFCAYGDDRAALEELASLMDGVLNDADRMRDLIAAAEDNRFGSDDYT